ncbi:hypothetical protein ACFXHA_23265 [Nocardia sp. NPDC059240]|uniref:hypothetical protein n=1 Tax=Nocardia sp. NPDC059240 TaxID=3346786 RepID=UPI00367B8696
MSVGLAAGIAGLAPANAATSAPPDITDTSTPPLPYRVPDTVIDKQIPADIDWDTVRSHDVRQLLPDSELGTLLDQQAPFSYGSGTKWSDAIPRIPREPGGEYERSGQNSFFIGKLQEKAPISYSTPQVMGPMDLTYSVSSSVTKTHTEQTGWTFGGSVGVKVPGISPSFSFGYSRVSSDSVAYQQASTLSAKYSVPDGKYGDIEVRKAGGEYLGYVFTQVNGGWQMSPVKFFVKAPGYDQPVTWNPATVDPTTHRVIGVGPARGTDDTDTQEENR